MIEGVAVGIVLALAGWLAPRGLGRGWRALVALVGLCLGVGAGALWTDAEPDRLAALRPADRSLADADYASSRTCRACHPDAYASWRRSYHRTMTQVASPQSVLPDWDGTLAAGGRSYHLVRDGDAFFVDVPAPGTNGEGPGERRRLPVVMTTGSHHMQLYWVPVPWADEEQATGGRGVYVERCAGCHGDEGEGTPASEDSDAPGWAPPLADGGRTPPQLRELLDEPDHAALHAPLTARERARVEHYVSRLQVRGRLQQFPFAWWIRGQRWLHEEDTFLQPPEPHPDHEDYEQTWSDACDQCHSVAPEASWVAEGPDAMASTAELGIACEACHGPAQAHADAYREPVGRYLERLGGDAAAHIVDPAGLDHRAATALCAQCHGEVVREDGDGPPFPVGEPLEPWGHLVQALEPPHPAWLADALEREPDLLATAFWRDGTMRVAGRDANALAISACYERGTLSCITCHDSHGDDPDDQLRPGARGDAICADCHPEVAAAGSAHTHHPVDSAGSRCMNCHMPHTTLGLLGAMRSHRIDSPSALRAHTTGRPDACTLCHTDRTLTWSAEALHDWYGHDVPDIGGDVRAASVEGLLRGDAAQRAVWAWHLGWEPAVAASGDDWQPAMLAYTLDDRYSAVRYIAGESLGRFDGLDDVRYDFTAEPEARRAVRAEVLRRWRATGAEPRPTVLVGERGLNEDLVRLLLTVQDSRPVVVSE